MFKNYLIGLVFYYVYVYLVLYVVGPLLQSTIYVGNILGDLLILNLIILLLYLCGALVSFRIRGEDISFERFGLREYGIGKSFIYSAAISAPIPLFWLIGTQIVGINTIMIAVRPSWSDLGVAIHLMPSAILIWLMTSIIAFVFWIAVPYELAKNFSMNRVIPAIAILWAGLYNTPFLTGKIDVIDVFFFGLLYSIVYHRTGNILGSIFSYLVVENPLWWVVSTILPFNDETIFLFLLLIRTTICITALAMVFIKEISVLKGGG